MASGFVPPFDRDEFHQAVLETYLTLARAVAFMAGDQAAWFVLGKPAGADFKYSLQVPELPLDWLDVTFQDISETPYAIKMEAMYDYAYFGMVDHSQESMDYEGPYMWITEYLCDLSRSSFAGELDEFGETTAIHSAQRCFRVAETANARRVLEGYDAFAPNMRNGKDDDMSGFQELSIRQMALLANMEEMSIRAAANPKRANPLITFSEAGRTRISPEVAKAWLILKGRYVRITPRWTEGNIDLAKKQFATPYELIRALNSRWRHLGGTPDHGETDQIPSDVDKQFTEIGISSFYSIESEQLSDENFVRQIAEVLDLPAELLVLRAKEAILREKLAQTEYLIRESQISATNS